MLTLDAIKSEVDRLAAKIGASGYILPTYGRSEDLARPHIEVDSRGYHYVVVGARPGTEAHYYDRSGRVAASHIQLRHIHACL